MTWTPGEDAPGDCGDACTGRDRLQGRGRVNWRKASKAAGMVMNKMLRCSFKSPCGKLVGVVHCDDILLRGPRSFVDAVRKSLRNRHGLEKPKPADTPMIVSQSGQDRHWFFCPGHAECHTVPEARGQAELLGKGSPRIDHGEPRFQPERCGYGQTHESGAISAWTTDHLDAHPLEGAIIPHHGTHQQRLGSKSRPEHCLFTMADSSEVLVCEG